MAPTSDGPDLSGTSAMNCSICTGCGNRIKEQYLLRVHPNMVWHVTCLKCQECGESLNEECTCFVRDGKPFCKEDYVRLFGTKCSKCGILARRTDLVMRIKSNVYHKDCFRCAVCDKMLVAGDEYIIKNVEDGPLCKTHYEANPNVAGGQNKEKRDHKTTRIRTVLTEKQLHTLRACYAANPRPDALMKEQMVEMTGLAPKVIRVWFQNKRCKDKKRNILLKQMHDNEMDGDVRHLKNQPMGIPMTASSPVMHDSIVNAQASQCPPQMSSWRALNDFAAEENIFHQLTSTFDSTDDLSPSSSELIDSESDASSAVGVHL